ncbi:tat pathway signal sequence domain-containing [Fusarium albosuccineum]|uniref:Tat pathway signal sequence domain-containing n=1 Tax=Fusarium albosuccineum TaxID=1237068 RepID=A0A8H4PDD5_9HYPO|nr:tat pathway signal sequence domain-containing [Fusarium albosuccineum]
MNFTRVLNALRGITWRYSMHHSKDGRRPEAEALIRQHYEDKNLEARGVETAEVVSPFHGGDGHPKEHVTVEFKDAEGGHVTTHHVRGPRDNK